MLAKICRGHTSAYILSPSPPAARFEIFRRAVPGHGCQLEFWMVTSPPKDVTRPVGASFRNGQTRTRRRIMRTKPVQVRRIDASRPRGT